MALPRGYCSIDGTSTNGRGRETFIIAKKKIDDLIKYGPGTKFYELDQVRETLDSPDAIFEGLKREDLLDSHCFSKVPANRKLKSGIEVPFPPGLVFLVFVNRDHRGCVILDWEKRKCDPETPGFPLGWRDDFENLTWRRH